MKKYLLSLIVILSFIAVPLTAQMPEPPKPLDSPMTKWLEGEWKGWMNNPEGKTSETLRYKLDLDGQYLLSEAISMMGDKVHYKGMGAQTVDPKTGKIMLVWIDNYRMSSEGTGKEEGNKMTMVFNYSGMKYERILEKVGPDKMKVTAKMWMPDGKVTNQNGEYTRVKK